MPEPGRRKRQTTAPLASRTRATRGAPSDAGTRQKRRRSFSDNVSTRQTNVVVGPAEDVANAATAWEQLMALDVKARELLQLQLFANSFEETKEDRDAREKELVADQLYGEKIYDTSSPNSAIRRLKLTHLITIFLKCHPDNDHNYHARAEHLQAVLKILTRDCIPAELAKHSDFLTILVDLMTQLFIACHKVDPETNLQQLWKDVFDETRVPHVVNKAFQMKMTQRASEIANSAVEGLETQFVWKSTFGGALNVFRQSVLYMDQLEPPGQLVPPDEDVEDEQEPATQAPTQAATQHSPSDEEDAFNEFTEGLVGESDEHHGNATSGTQHEEQGLESPVRRVTRSRAAPGDTRKSNRIREAAKEDPKEDEAAASIAKKRTRQKKDVGDTSRPAKRGKARKGDVTDENASADEEVAVEAGTSKPQHQEPVDELPEPESVNVTEPAAPTVEPAEPVVAPTETNVATAVAGPTASVPQPVANDSIVDVDSQFDQLDPALLGQWVFELQHGATFQLPPPRTPGSPSRSRQPQTLLQGLDEAARAFRREVQDPMQRVYEEVNRQFPREAGDQQAGDGSARRLPRDWAEDDLRYPLAIDPHYRLQINGGRPTLAFQAPHEREASMAPSLAESTTTSIYRPRRPRRPWPPADVEMLERGLMVHQNHPRRWRLILDQGVAEGLFEGRTNVDLKDKARQMREARTRAGLPLGGFMYAHDRPDRMSQTPAPE
ncbi:hypothetical protein HDU85_000966 [Gaertneriomyces sp. JEL0708]|nr:hypothetical protein HDU85_000966 [Gaertneriomyces sp. JEL0708]